MKLIDNMVAEISHLLSIKVYSEYMDKVTMLELQENIEYGLRVFVYNTGLVLIALLMNWWNLKIFLPWAIIFAIHNLINKKAHFKNTNICLVYSMIMYGYIPMIVRIIKEVIQ